jgi:hypothetical protein
VRQAEGEREREGEGRVTPVVGSMILTVTFSRGTPAQPNRLLPQWSDAGRVSEAGGAKGGEGRGGEGEAHMQRSLARSR